MSKSLWLLSTALVGLAYPAQAQVTSRPSGSPSPSQQSSAAAGADASDPSDPGTIIVTGNRRSDVISNVPLAMSAVSGASLANSGAVDTRMLNQITSSLLVSSSSTEAQGGGARIRGIGTVGDNPGLESSVATFIDGVYRNRAGVGLTELGAIDRIEVLRGPQGTLFGRNASAGLISVITAQPKFEDEGTAELSYGNYDYWRGVLGITGPINQKIAYRLDGVYTKRDGFIRATIGPPGSPTRDINDRDRWLARGQLLFEPVDGLSLRLIADYAKRNEECCAGVYVPTRNVSRAPDGSLIFLPSTIAAFERALGATINEDTYARRTAIPAGRSYRSDVRDGGVSGELNYDLGGLKLTSITAYRDWKYVRGQAANFNNLDLLYRDDDGSANQRFKTFTQELRAQGKAFGDRLDFLVGGYFANEKLTLNDNLSYGRDYGLYETCQISASLGTLSPTSPACLSPLGRAGLNSGLSSLGAAGPLVVAGLDRIAMLTNQPQRDHYEQTSRNLAIFTHNIFSLTDRLKLTLGARYTNERKTLDASLTNGAVQSMVCTTNGAALGALRDNPASPASLRSLAGSLVALSCVNPSVPNGAFTQNDAKKSEHKLTGTAILSYKPIDQVLTYASFSRGYKAGGFNLDRNGLNRAGKVLAADGSTLINGTGAIDATANLQQLTFAPEEVDAFELGAKYNGRGFDLNVSAFYQRFDNFQLNTFNGVNFVVENINGCSADLGTAPIDSNSLNGGCTGKVQSGVISQGVELEAYMTLSKTLHATQGFTLADTRYRHDLVGTAGRPLNAAFFQLPGRRVSNSSLYTLTGSATWTPPLGSGGMHALVYADYRYQSDINTGSDLDLEKENNGVLTINARVGVSGADGLWSVELWGQNVTNVNYRQVGFDMPLQGSGTTRQTESALFGTTSTQLYGLFPAEPRTYGVTVRTKF